MGTDRAIFFFFGDRLQMSGTTSEDIQDMLLHLRSLVVVLRSLPDQQWVRRVERLEDWIKSLPSEDLSSRHSPFAANMTGFGTLVESTPLLHDPLSKFLGALERYSRKERCGQL
jgi:hypothetical protein